MNFKNQVQHTKRYDSRIVETGLLSKMLEFVAFYVQSSWGTYELSSNIGGVRKSMTRNHISLRFGFLINVRNLMQWFYSNAVDARNIPIHMWFQVIYFWMLFLYTSRILGNFDYGMRRIQALHMQFVISVDLRIKTIEVCTPWATREPASVVHLVKNACDHEFESRPKWKFSNFPYDQWLFF